MVKRDRQETQPHIGTAEIEKIPLGQGKFLWHIGDRFFINSLDAQGKTTWEEIQPGEQVFIGRKQISIPRQLFFGEDRITISAYRLFLSKKFWQRGFRQETQVFCNDISFQAKPGTITGIMGPSGAGKTVLLNLLSGYVYSKENTGRIFLNDSFDVQQDRRLLGRTIGYVPQDDTLIPQLTVQDSLNYAFRLRYPHVESSLKHHIIRDTCQKSGFTKETETLLSSPIGSPDAKTLSGGQRKRVNIAHELIRNPLLLFLDEPTSGLSSVDADTVIQSLKDLCEKTRITIILTIHQPSVRSFDLLDRLLLLNQGGNIIYFGGAQKAVEYFEDHTKTTKEPGKNPAEFLLESLEVWKETVLGQEDQETQSIQSIAKAYRQKPDFFPYSNAPQCPSSSQSKQVCLVEITEAVFEKLHNQGISLDILERLQSSFTITRQSLKKFKEENLPDELVQQLGEFTGRCFVENDLDTILSEEQVQAYKDTIVRHAKACSLQDREFFWRDELRDELERVLGDAYSPELGQRILKLIVEDGLTPQRVAGRTKDRSEEVRQGSFSCVYQCAILLRRNLAVSRADKNTRRFQLIQPVIIGLLMLAAFSWYTQDYYGEDILSRIGLEFTKKWKRETIVPSQDLPEAKRRAYNEANLISEGTANRRAAVFFLLIASCIWFGVINACREIVDERTVLKREAKSSLNISSYLIAKVLFLAWICLKQVVILLLVVALPNILAAAPFPQHVKALLVSTELITHISFAGLFGILWGASVLSSWLGLCISAIAPTQRFALTAVPLLIIPQLLLGGLIRPIRDIDRSQSFMITAEALQQLSQQQIPQATLDKLEKMKTQRFTREQDFWFAVISVLEEKPDTRLRKLLQQVAKMPAICARNPLPVHIHDFMLQKWSFRAVLQYDSMGNMQVLRKMVDVNKYDRYRYLQFEPVKIIDLFFVVTEDMLDVSELLLRTILIHALVLLIPTYLWLKIRLQY